jgi:hypothetical protein
MGAGASAAGSSSGGSGMGAGAAAAGMIGLGAVSGAIGSVQNARAQASYFSYLSGQARLSAKLAKARGEMEARQAGDQEFYAMRDLNRRVDAARGSQAAVEAANGIAGSVTAQEIGKTTLDRAEIDREAIRYNADSKMIAARAGGDMAAFNERSQAGADDLSGGMARMAGSANAMSSILGGGGSLAAMWYRSKT